MVENICYGNKLFARIIKTSKFDGVFKFFTEDEDNLQVSAWNHKKGYECVPHIHNVIPHMHYIPSFSAAISAICTNRDTAVLGFAKLDDLFSVLLRTYHGSELSL